MFLVPNSCTQGLDSVDTSFLLSLSPFNRNFIAMPVEISKFDPHNLEASEKYLLRTLATEIITDVANPYKEEYMEFAGILAGHFLPVDIPGRKALTFERRSIKPLKNQNRDSIIKYTKDTC